MTDAETPDVVPVPRASTREGGVSVNPLGFGVPAPSIPAAGGF